MFNIKNRNTFFQLASQQFISDIGNWFYTIAISTMIYKLTGSAFAFSATILFSLLPQAFFSLLGGGFSDRYNAKYIIVVTNIIRGFVALLALLFTGVENLYILYLIAFVNSTLGAVANTSKYIIIKQTFERENISMVISNLRVLTEIALILGSGLGSLGIVSIGYNFLVIINSITFFIAAIISIFIKYKHIEIEKIGFNISKTIQTYIDGFKLVLKDNALKTLFYSRFFIIFGTGFLNALPPILGVAFYSKSANQTGIIYIAIAVGAMTGAKLSSKLKYEKLSLKFIILCSMLVSISFIMLAFFNINIIVGCIVIIVVSFANILFNTYLESYAVTKVGEEYVGRVSGVYLCLLFLTLIISLTGLPLIADINLTYTFITASIVTSIPAIFLTIKAVFNK